MKKRWIVPIALVMMLALVVAGAALASSGGDYEIVRWTVDSGGTTLTTGGGYLLGGTAGQPDAGMWGSSGYALAGGFWGGGSFPAGGYDAYLPLVFKALQP
jgi:hypothetical protein